MSTKITVKRTDLITKLKAKAAANQKAWDEQQKLQPTSTLRDTLIQAIRDAFKNVPEDKAGTAQTNQYGYTRANAVSAASVFLTDLGAGSLTMTQFNAHSSNTSPQLYERQLAILEMSADETLTVDDSSDYFAFLS